MARSEGAIYQRHDHPTCPDDTDTPHRCRGHWAVQVEMAKVAGKRRRITRYAATEKQALAIRAQLLRERDAGRTADDPTVKAWLTHWLKDIAPETASTGTLRNYRGHAENWIIPTLGRLKLSQVRPEDVRKLRRVLETSPRRSWKGNPMHAPDGAPVLLSPTSVRNVLVTLDAAMTAALRERRITWNPVESVRKPQASDEHHAHLSPQQARAILDAATDAEEQARLAVALYAGLRQGEALALTWEHVDFDAGVIRVRQSVRRGVVTPETKTPWSIRDVPMHALVRSTLGAWQAESVGPYVFGGVHPRSTSVDYRWWKAATARIGIHDVPLHGARATFGVMLRDAGVPVSTIGEILGHKPGSPVTVLAYAHARSDELAAGVRALEARQG